MTFISPTTNPLIFTLEDEDESPIFVSLYELYVIRWVLKARSPRVEYLATSPKNILEVSHDPGKDLIVSRVTDRVVEGVVFDNEDGYQPINVLEETLDEMFDGYSHSGTLTQSPKRDGGEVIFGDHDTEMRLSPNEMAFVKGYLDEAKSNRYILGMPRVAIGDLSIELDDEGAFFLTRETEESLTMLLYDANDRMEVSDIRDNVFASYVNRVVEFHINLNRHVMPDKETNFKIGVA